MAILEIYKSTNLTMNFDDSKSLLELIWVDGTKPLSNEKFKEEMMIYRDAVVKHHVKFVLNESVSGSFVVTPEIQDWIAENIFPHTVKSLLKIAYVLPWTLIQKLAIEQMIEEYEIKDLNKVISSKYFKSSKEALVWLSTN